MPGSIADRMRALGAGLRGDASARRVPLRDTLRSSLSWYGLSRARVARSIRLESAEDGMRWAQFDDYGLAWPAGAPVGRLATALIELRAPSNPHYYFRQPTTVRRDDRVLDVGACEGAFALECLVRFGAGMVWCFEPSPTMARALRLTAARNGLADRMRVVEAAVSSVAGASTLVEDERDPLVARVEAAGPETGARTATVQQVTLDEWAERHGVDRVDYVKVDAEGSDVRVLEGARGLLARHRPRIAVTTYHEPPHCEEIIALLRSLDAGYTFTVRGLVVQDAVPRPVLLHASTPGS